MRKIFIYYKNFENMNCIDHTPCIAEKREPPKTPATP